MAAFRDLEQRARDRVGETLSGKWRLDQLLGLGGMAAVYAATHRNGKRVAIKILHSIHAQNEEARVRFMREGYAANSVGHPGVVQVLDDDELEDGSAFLVMELLEGMSMDARLHARQNLSAAEVMLIGERVLDVLGCAHARDVIHRDIKPANIFLTSEGDVKVLDFGLARVRERAFKGRMTRSGIVLGTFSYMPPEQARGKRDLVDQRSDLWAMGATMFRALAGRHVHEGPTANERLLATMSQPAPALASVAPHVPPELADIVDRALAFQKHERWPDAHSMQRALHDAYQRLERRPMPQVNRGVTEAGWVVTARSLEIPVFIEEASDVHVSIVVEESVPSAQSIVVEVEEPDGHAERFELRKVQHAGEDIDEDDLSELTLVDSAPSKYANRH
jgi:serine/threonine protein kinase